jgi:2-dehydro-3-deoxyphosphogluconate aldolase/(4S)-4-hydroxy-2-oxoglutarate aldolase
VIKKISSQAIIGAGTVLNLEQAERAVASGAQFLVSPGLNIEVLKWANKNEIPFFPGVLTPTEIMWAKAEGCQLLKIFPISAVGGSSYLQALGGPFPDLKWMPTGGISLANLGQFVKAKAHCVGMGGQLIPNELIKAKNWSALTAVAVKHLEQLEIERKS